MMNIKSLVVMTASAALLPSAFALFDASANTNMAVYWVGPEPAEWHNGADTNSDRVKDHIRNHSSSSAMTIISMLFKSVL